MAWTQEEEVRLLRAALEIAEEPVAAFDPSVSLFGRIRRMLVSPFTDDEILAKIKELKRNYEDNGVGVCDTVAFEISSRIWGRVRGKRRRKTTTTAKKMATTSSVLVYFRRRLKKPN